MNKGIIGRFRLIQLCQLLRIKDQKISGARNPCQFLQDDHLTSLIRFHVYESTQKMLLLPFFEWFKNKGISEGHITIK